MNLYRTILAAAVSATAATPALAVELEKPKAYGYLSAGALKIESNDAEAQAFELELGLQGKAVIEDGLNLHYALEVDLAPAANDADHRSPGGESELHVKEAKFWLPTKYGIFVAAPRGTSGHWVELYGPINHYEYNEPHAELNPDGIFAQPDRTSGTFAYHTPKLMNTKLVAAAITLYNDNGQDADGRSVRIVYDDGRLGMGIGTTMLMQEQLPPFATDDYLISVASAQYRIGGLSLGAVWERNDDSPYPFAPEGKADFDAYGVSASYVADSGMGIALGYKEKDHDFDAADENVYTLKVEQRITPKVKVWAETGQYDVLPSNYAVGFNLTF